MSRIILDYIRQYKNNSKVIELVAEMYGVLFPMYIDKSNYIYLYDTISGYDHIINREPIKFSYKYSNSSIKNFTMSEILKYSNADIRHWRNYKDFYEQFKVSNDSKLENILKKLCSTNSYTFSQIFSSFIAPFNDPIFQSQNKKYEDKIKVLFECARLCVLNDNHLKFSIIMGKLSSFSMVEEYIKKYRIIMLQSLHAENYEYIRYFVYHNFESDIGIYTNYKDFFKILVQEYIFDLSFNQERMEYIIQIANFSVVDILFPFIKFIYTKEIAYSSFDNQTLFGCLMKIKILIKLSEKDEKEQLSKLLENIILFLESQDKNAEKYLKKNKLNVKNTKYHNIYFYKKCLKIVKDL